MAVLIRWCSFALLWVSVTILPAQDTVELTSEFRLIQISSNTWIHQSDMTLEPYGTFGCNGLLYLNSGQALLADTPVNSHNSGLLIDWLSKRDLEITGIVVTHFHEDCLGGLEVFHELGIPSYAHQLTPGLAKKSSAVPPRRTFSYSLALEVAGKPVIAAYLGEAHSPDNVVVYIPSENVLFGGCMVKSLNSGKGNLEDANVDKWSETVSKVATRFKPKVVIPGHGSYGGPELLEYTIDLFQPGN